MRTIHFGNFVRSATFTAVPFILGTTAGYVIAPVLTSLVTAPVIGITQLDAMNDEETRKNKRSLLNTFGTKVASAFICLTTGGVCTSSFFALKRNVADIKQIPGFLGSSDLFTRNNAKKIFFKGLNTSCALWLFIASGFLVVGQLGRFVFHSPDSLTVSERLAAKELELISLKEQLKAAKHSEKEN